MKLWYSRVVNADNGLLEGRWIEYEACPMFRI
jgi:hypothetical protein